MFAYLVLLYDPAPHALVAVEEPENQLYPELLLELVEEFRDYARRGGQVFISTHSPDFLNGTKLEEIYWLVKEGGFATVRRADRQRAAPPAHRGRRSAWLPLEAGSLRWSGVEMSRVVFLLEEYSMKVLLEGLLPRLVPCLPFLCVPHEGKQDLERSIPRKLRAWREPGVRFVVVRDNDGSDCRALKARLAGLL